MLNVKERGRHVATFRWVEVRLMEMLAAWVPTTPEMEAKLLFGEHIWDTAQHADALGRRTQELRLPEQHSLPPTRSYADLLDELAAVPGTAERIAGFYDCALAGADRLLERYLSDVDTLLDGPTVRIIERILFDTTRMHADAAKLRTEHPALALGDTDWLDDLRRREAATTVVPAALADPVDVAHEGEGGQPS